MRFSRLAHLVQTNPKLNLPSIAAFEELTQFAIELHRFVNEGFLNVVPHPILLDNSLKSGLTRILNKLGVSEVAQNVPDI